MAGMKGEYGGEYGGSSEEGDWNEDIEYFPNDGYDYEQHMWCPDKFPIEGTTLVMVPDDLEERRQDPLFTGELECRLEIMSEEERDLVRALQEGKDVSSEDADDDLFDREDNDERQVQHLISTQLLPKGKDAEDVARKLIWHGFEARGEELERLADEDKHKQEDDTLTNLRQFYVAQLAIQNKVVGQNMVEDIGGEDIGGEDIGGDHSRGEDADSEDTGAANYSSNSSEQDILDLALGNIDDKDLLAALEGMNDSDFDDDDNQEVLTTSLRTDIERTNLCADLVLKHKNPKNQEIDRDMLKEYIINAAQRQEDEYEQYLEEQASDEDNLTDDDLTDIMSTNKFQFDRSLFVNMNKSKWDSSVCQKVKRDAQAVDLGSLGII
ncbi:hypothetical protein GNI_190830 [Gregarina niphandrodes]|uniref:Uncharacterized protein n=1 Tax=Gregarina niphandrodes TaxID=110365 RepID=A0A023AWH3_GRENI|nr:hypothetical protein GNI_190830 [Gregarina niphandrodes]EZG43064.1 hypothetical protein GNI_190830 [Gregarina niphandrodes]|eukprot:XP_011133662.1 hypothetical protein GNI_190830 [Gregarina niphandrodes]